MCPLDGHLVKSGLQEERSLDDRLRHIEARLDNLAAAADMKTSRLDDLTNQIALLRESVRLTELVYD